MTQSKTDRLDALFDRWFRGADVSRIHRDGIIDETQFEQERLRLLFVMLEGSADGPGSAEFLGQDLRHIYGEGRPRKTLTHNLGRWTRLLLDGIVDPEPLDGDDLARALNRVAVMNLKKLTGGAASDVDGVLTHAWRDRRAIREEISIIEPDVIVAGGRPANAILANVLRDDRESDAPSDMPWAWRGIHVLPALNPSHRRPTGEGLDRLAELARAAGLE